MLFKAPTSHFIVFCFQNLKDRKNFICFAYLDTEVGVGIQGFTSPKIDRVVYLKKSLVGHVKFIPWLRSILIFPVTGPRQTVEQVSSRASDMSYIANYIIFSTNYERKSFELVSLCYKLKKKRFSQNWQSLNPQSFIPH